MKTLENGENLTNLISTSKVLLIHFGSGSCGPCAALRDKIDVWSVPDNGVDSVYVPIESFPEVAASRSIFTVPTILVYTEGKLSIRESGCFSLDGIFSRIERYLSLMDA